MCKCEFFWRSEWRVGWDDRRPLIILPGIRFFYLSKRLYSVQHSFFFGSDCQISRMNIGKDANWVHHKNNLEVVDIFRCILWNRSKPVSLVWKIVLCLKPCFFNYYHKYWTKSKNTIMCDAWTTTDHAFSGPIVSKSCLYWLDDGAMILPWLTESSLAE